MKLNKDILNRSKKLKTPFLLVDIKKAIYNYRRIKKSIDGVEVFYAMKANSTPHLLEALTKEGGSFEISSLAELNALLQIGVSPTKIVCFNPIKRPEFLIELEKAGVHVMAYDSTEEVDKIAKYAPSAKVVLRISVSNEGSDWPLTKKFGIDPTEALQYLKYAKKKKLHPIGLTFHVGSQCLNKNNWGSALYVCEQIWKSAQEKGIYLNLLSLGGGLPIHHLKNTPTVEEIGSLINKIIKTNFTTPGEKLVISIEPGRGLIGDAAIMGTTVVGKAKRGSENWIYTDVGVFNGFMETIENFQYEIKTEKRRKKLMTTIAGPSCDSVDIMFKNIALPKVEIGEKLYIINAGAYTTVYASEFNGFDIPEVHFIE